jgi:hypothetical protein
VTTEPSSSARDEGQAAYVNVDAERLERLRSAIGRALAVAFEWQEGAIMRGERAEVCDAFSVLAMLTQAASTEALLLTYREPEPGVFERLLTAPGEQFDKGGEVLRSVLAHQQGGCRHASARTTPPATMGGTAVTACPDCGLYL